MCPEFAEGASERLKFAAIRYGDKYYTRSQHHADGTELHCLDIINFFTLKFSIIQVVVIRWQFMVHI